MRTISHLWIEKGRIDQFSLGPWKLCEMSRSSDFRFIQNRNLLISYSYFVTMLVFLFTVLLLPKKFFKKLNRYEKNWNFVICWDLKVWALAGLSRSSVVSLILGQRNFSSKSNEIQKVGSPGFQCCRISERTVEKFLV